MPAGAGCALSSQFTEPADSRGFCQVKLNGGKEVLDLNASLVELKLSPACLEPFVPSTNELEQEQVCMAMGPHLRTLWWSSEPLTQPHPAQSDCLHGTALHCTALHCTAQRAVTTSRPCTPCLWSLYDFLFKSAVPSRQQAAELCSPRTHRHPEQCLLCTAARSSGSLCGSCRSRARPRGCAGPGKCPRRRVDCNRGPARQGALAACHAQTAQAQGSGCSAGW